MNRGIWIPDEARARPVTRQLRIAPRFRSDGGTACVTFTSAPNLRITWSASDLAQILGCALGGKA
jgi:hypothetical protein